MFDNADQHIWLRVRQDVERYPSRTFVRYQKRDLPHPREAGAHASVGIPRGQVGDYRFPPDSDCRGLHVQEFEEYWEVHVDEVHPACDLFDHLRTDAPDAWTFSGAVLGGVIGAAIGRSGNATLAGALLGLVVAKATSGRDRLPEQT